MIVVKDLLSKIGDGFTAMHVDTNCDGNQAMVFYDNSKMVDASVIEW